MNYTIEWIDEPAQTVRVPIISGLPIDDPQACEDALIRAFNAWGALGQFDASVDEHWSVLSIMGGQ